MIHPDFFIHTTAAWAVSISSRDGLGTARPQEGGPELGQSVCGLEVEEREGKATGAVASRLPLVSTPQVQAAGILFASLFKEA